MDDRPESALPPPSTTPIEPAQLPPQTAPPRRRRYGWLWAFVFLLLLLMLGLWLGRRHRAKEAETAKPAARPGIPVTVATAQRGSVAVYDDAIGTVTALHTDVITAQVAGIVTAVHYQEGQMVAAGDALVDIDARPYEAQLEQAQGALARDQSLLAEAQMDLERYQQAWAQNAIPRQTLEDQEKVVAQDQGTVQNDQGTVHYDQVEVGFCHITAPIAGRVGLRLVDPGNAVTAGGGTALVVITQMQPITVIFTLAEGDLGAVEGQIQADQKLAVQAWDAQEQHQIATGTLESIDNQIDTTTATVKLRAQFDNADGKLYPNQFVYTRLRLKTLNNQTLVPPSAVQHNGTTDFVYLIENGKAMFQKVTSGITDNNQTAVQGIAPGQVVANSSFDKLQNGAPVTISTVALPASDSTTSLVP